MILRKSLEMAALGPTRAGACLVQHLWWFVRPEQVTSTKNKSGAPPRAGEDTTVLKFRMRATKLPINYTFMHARSDTACVVRCGALGDTFCWRALPSNQFRRGCVFVC